jgi:hypothetical protein
MSASNIIRVGDLDEGYILSANRYDPRRRVPHRKGVPLVEVAQVVNEQLSPKAALETPLRVLDTNSAFEGAIIHWNSIGSSAELGSNKKCAQGGDVIISRLRPYLRQTAFVDLGAAQEKVVCSTEFFVLRGINEQSIGFLVPFLLSRSVVDYLCNSVEGGHHPRVAANTIEDLRIPESLFERRDRVSKNVEEAVLSIRSGLAAIEQLSRDI